MIVPVRGVEAMKVDLSILRDGQRINLVAEPSNPYDPNAIQVRTPQGYLIGYIPRDLAARLRAWEWDANVSEILYHDGLPKGVRLRLNPKEFFNV